MHWEARSKKTNLRIHFKRGHFSICLLSLVFVQEKSSRERGKKTVWRSGALKFIISYDWVCLLTAPKEPLGNAMWVSTTIKASVNSVSSQKLQIQSCLSGPLYIWHWHANMQNGKQHIRITSRVVLTEHFRHLSNFKTIPNVFRHSDG